MQFLFAHDSAREFKYDLSVWELQYDQSCFMYKETVLQTNKLPKTHGESRKEKVQNHRIWYLAVIRHCVEKKIKSSAKIRSNME